MRRRDEDRLAGDAVHEDAGRRLNVVHVDVAVLRDQVDHVVFRAHLYNGKMRINENFDVFG